MKKYLVTHNTKGESTKVSTNKYVDIFDSKERDLIYAKDLVDDEEVVDRTIET